MSGSGADLKSLNALRDAGMTQDDVERDAHEMLARYNATKFLTDYTGFGNGVSNARSFVDEVSGIVDISGRYDSPAKQRALDEAIRAAGVDPDKLKIADMEQKINELAALSPEFAEEFDREFNNDPEMREKIKYIVGKSEIAEGIFAQNERNENQIVAGDIATEIAARSDLDELKTLYAEAEAARDNHSLSPEERVDIYIAFFAKYSEVLSEYGEDGEYKDYEDAGQVAKDVLHKQVGIAPFVFGDKGSDFLEGVATYLRDALEEGLKDIKEPAYKGDDAQYARDRKEFLEAQKGVYEDVLQDMVDTFRVMKAFPEMDMQSEELERRSGISRRFLAEQIEIIDLEIECCTVPPVDAPPREERSRPAEPQEPAENAVGSITPTTPRFG